MNMATENPWFHSAKENRQKRHRDRVPTGVIMQNHTIRGLAIIIAALAAGPVNAADIYSPMTPQHSQTTTDSGWTISFAPYFWAAGLSGDAAQFGLPSVHVDADFGKIFDNLEFGAMAMGEARNGPYSLFADIMYTRISGQADTRRGILAQDVELTTKTFAGLLGAGYAVFDTGTSQLDIVGGVRVWNVKSELSFSGGLLDGVSRTDKATWVDGLVGLRGTYSFTPKVYLTGWGLAGAGGADLDWDVATAVGYRFNDTVSAVVGYRALGVDYGKDGFVFDVVQQGPITGLTIRF